MSRRGAGGGDDGGRGRGRGHGKPLVSRRYIFKMLCIDLTTWSRRQAKKAVRSAQGRLRRAEAAASGETNTTGDGGTNTTSSGETNTNPVGGNGDTNLTGGDDNAGS